tara:strand:- start:495 stop:689 length:195 start_codon:yes stop_codon:yes gene_type:complete
MSGEELKDLRAKHQVSQQELAIFLGYTVKGQPNRSQIARFENGYAKINPRIAMLINLYMEKKNG